MSKRTSWQEAGKQDAEWEFYTYYLRDYGVKLPKKNLYRKLGELN